MRPFAWGVAVVGLLAISTGANAQNLPPGFEDVGVVEGLVRPTSLTVGPDGRVYIAEQAGRVLIVDEGELLPAIFLELPVFEAGERGLMSITFDIDYETNGYVYAYYTHASETFNRLSRFHVDPLRRDRVDGIETVLLDGIRAAKFHNGGAVIALPDRTLLISVGDGEVDADAASLETLNGKILRIDTDGGIPADNPYVGRPPARPEIWASGLRNPFGIARNEATGRILINDVGKKGSEEVNEGASGADYGWPACEGSCGAPFGDPLYTYNHSQGCAITGGTFYDGSNFPTSYEGVYFFADFCSEWIRVLGADGHADAFVSGLGPGIVDLAVAPDGSLLYLDYAGGRLRRIRFVGSGNRTPTAAATADPPIGNAPLSVSFDASGSFDPDGEPLVYSWDFGDGGAGEGTQVSHQFTAKGPYRVVLTATDPQGARDQDKLSVMVGTPPEPRILTPGAGATFEWGERIDLVGEATDAADGPIPDSHVDWTVVLHHHREDEEHHHTHPFLSLADPSTFFELAERSHAPGEYVWFRVHFTARDSDGLIAEATVDLLPR